MSQTTQQPPAGGSGRSTRGNPSMADILRSVALLAVVLLVVVEVGGWFRHDTVVEPKAVDYEAVSRQAAGEASFPVLVPPALPDGWRATQARWDATAQHWHLGLLTEDDVYVGVEQMRSATLDDLVSTYLEGGEPDGDVAVGGAPWRVYVDAGDGRTALLRTDAGVTTMVLGGQSRDVLGSFADSLEPAPEG
jgi:hypothetical protein